MKNEYRLKKQIKAEQKQRMNLEEQIYDLEVELHKMRSSFRWKISNYPYKLYKKYLKPAIPKSFFITLDIVVKFLRRLEMSVSDVGYWLHSFFNGKVSRKIYFTIGIASYNHSEYLNQCIESCLRQDYKYFNILIVDDNSSDPKNKEILKKYKKHPRIGVIFKNKNEGISASLNDQAIYAKGNWVAFVDCDDYLPKEALSSMAKYIKMHPRKRMVVSNRIEVDKDDKILQKVNFQKRFRKKDIFKMLLDGMVSSHLKVIHKDVFRKVGLFDQRFGGTHDYDMFLRVAFYMPKAFGFINKYLYYHRIHSAQNTLIDKSKHRKNVRKIIEEARFREKIYSSGIKKTVSIIVLSFNRYVQTKKTIEKIFTKFSKSKIKFDLLVWDNASQDLKLKKYLKFINGKRNTKVVFSKKNIRASGGRLRATKMVSGDYVLYFDNDIEVVENLLEELIIRLEEDKKNASCCCKILFPDKTIQYTGGMIKKNGEKMIKFLLDNNGLIDNNLKSMIKKKYDWLGTGATMTKREYLHLAKFDDKFLNAYEDNDYYMQFIKAGLNLVHCPTIGVVHHHINFEILKDAGTKKYIAVRHNKDFFIDSWVHFYRKWGLIIDDPFILKMIAMDNETEKNIETYLKNFQK